jgi:uncharacterized protein (DUF305 family)
MTPSKATRISATLLVAIALSACSSTGRSAMQASASPMTAPENEAVYIAQARADSIRLPYTEADVNFMSGMIHHHAQALVMSHWAPTHGASAPVLRLASRIINAQQDEIVTMQRWLRDRQKPVQEATPGGMTMVMDGMEHTMLMPGMLTEAQLKQLDDARGKDFDRLFLTFMIQHHQGAVTMVTDLFDTYGAAQDISVFKLASDISADQTTEIERMQKMLASVIFGAKVE